MKSVATKILLALFLVTIIGVVACNKEGGDAPATDNFDRKALLTNVADNIIIPAFTNYQTNLAALKTAADAYVAAPDVAKLTTLRQQWKAAYLAWQKVSLFNFGPADNVLLRNYTNIYPTDVALLRSYISSGNYNLEEIATNKVQGFPALDYLLNGAGASDTEIVANYTSGADAAKWKKYLTDVIGSMSTKLNTVVDAWKGAYRQQFIANDGTGAGSSLSLMTNEYIMYFERFYRSGKFGIPAGVMSGTPAPEKVEAFYSKNIGVELAQTALKASKDFYLGKTFNGGASGPSLYTYLQALGKNNANVATLATTIEAQFGTIETKLNSLGASVYNAIVTNRSNVLALYDELQKEVRYLKVDMTSAIGITISYTDNDGD